MNRAHLVTSMATAIALVGLAAFGCTTPPEVGPSESMNDQPGTPDEPAVPGSPHGHIDLSGGDDVPGGPDSPGDPGLPSDPSGGTPDVPTCGASTVVTLLAGQSHNAGTVTIENDDAALCVRMTTKPGWYISATHINISLVPVQGNPAPGSFTDVQEHDPAVTSYMACFSLEAFGYEPGMNVYVAAHASLVHYTGLVVDAQDSGWGHGTPGSGHNWAQYIEHTIQECVAAD